MRYLFQGDSITDCFRQNQEDPRSTGCGYVRLLEAELGVPDGTCEVLNCGIGGNRVVDLLARWKKDCLNLDPDVVTILIGVNDVWHEMWKQNGVSVPLFEEVYRILLRETLAALPEVRLVLMGAYVMPGTATSQDWDWFYREVKARRDVVRRLAEEFRLDYVDLQEAFDEAQKKFPTGHWTGDGVHLTAAGHQIIAQAWKKAVGIGGC